MIHGHCAPQFAPVREAFTRNSREEVGAAIAERAAQAYNTYQKCGINGARRLLVTGW